MRRKDDLVEVGFIEHRIEEGYRGCQAVGGDHGGVCDKTIAPAHGVGSLAAALHKK